MLYAGCHPVKKKPNIFPSDSSSYQFSLLPLLEEQPETFTFHNFKLLWLFYLFDYFHCVGSISDSAFCADVRCAETVFCPFHQICLRRMTAVNRQPNFMAIEKHVIQYVSTVNQTSQVFLVVYICCLINTCVA